MDESVVKEFEQQQVGKLKLSQAIRIGAKIRPQCFHAYADGIGSCALMAGAEAFGMPYPKDGVQSHVVHRFLQTHTIAPKHALGHAVTLSDDKHWTREQIADWFESKGL